MQRHTTETCLSLYYDRLRNFGVDSFRQGNCGCINNGSNRTSSWPNDIVLIRVGEIAVEHFTRYGESLLEEIQRRRIEGGENLRNISRIYAELEERFRTTVGHLRHDEKLLSREIVTRGYLLEFDRLGID
jgi:hypothetical protein